jgi:hypothetical protein
MCVRPERDPEGSCETEVSNLEVRIAVDEQVLRFQVTVDDTMRVAENQTRTQLPHKFLKDRQKGVRNPFRRANWRRGP